MVMTLVYAMVAAMVMSAAAGVLLMIACLLPRFSVNVGLAAGFVGLITFFLKVIEWYPGLGF